MGIKNLKELDFSAQAGIVGGVSFGECTCIGSCVCKCDSSSPSNSTKSDNKEWQADETSSRKQRNNL